jgi:hypothetical protein
MFPAMLVGCHLNAVPFFDLTVYIVNRASVTATVTISGPVRSTLPVHSCSESGIGLAEGQYVVLITQGPHNASLELPVTRSSAGQPQRVILVMRDGSVDWDSPVDPNAKPC